MSVSPFERFIDLVKFDQAMAQTLQACHAKEQQADLLEIEKQKIVAELDLLKQSVYDAQKVVHEKELESKKLDVRQTDIKKKLDDIENAKQYVALKKELDVLQTQQQQHEEVLIKAWNQLESAQYVLAQKKDAFLQKISEADQLIASAEHELAALDTQLEHAAAKRPDIAALVNPEWLTKYEAMQGRVDNPVVEVVQGACGGCFYAIPQHELARLKNKALLECNSCYRFLYDPTVMSISSQTNPAAG